jgi:two-component system LytT family response regulator
VSEPLRVAIVDDEPLARESIRMLLAHDPEVAVAAECSGVDAPAAIEKTRPHILFLDVQMPELDGFGVLEALRGTEPPVTVFVTAYDTYALRAFDVHALDYLLKPFDDARFEKTLSRAKERVRERGADGATARILELLDERQRAQRYARRFLVRVREKVIVVNADEIDWIEGAGYYVSLHAGPKAHLLRETMAELETRLDPERFFRVHRSAIVNIDRVREVHPLFRGDCQLVLSDGTELRLSRTRRAEFDRLFRR